MFFCTVSLLLPAVGGTSLPAQQKAGDETPSPLHRTSAQWGGGPSRNFVCDAGSIPAEWNAGEFDYRTGNWLGGEQTRNVKWVARLGSETYGTPIIAGGKVFCATNNGAGYLERYPESVDLGVLLAFDAFDGDFLWQYSAEKLKDRGDIDWPEQGICSNPLVEGDRLWVVTNRSEVVCLDTEGFRDGENDGPFQDEAVEAENEADVIWKFDMREELGTQPHSMTSNSPTAWGDDLLLGTSNGVGADDEEIPAPNAPSFLMMDKNTGEVLWSDASPGENILDGQWGSPAAGHLGEVDQMLFPGGDGVLYSFSIPPRGERPEFLWKFDCNPKDTVWEGFGYGDRNTLIATPSIAGAHVFIATGQDPEAGEGQGDFWCLDPRRRGDISAEIVVDADGEPVPYRRYRAVDPERGEKILPNPNSAVRWHYRGTDPEEGEFVDQMHRSLSTAVIFEDLVVIADYGGVVHCLDRDSGRRLWFHDMMCTLWGSPMVADGKVYIADEDGDVAVFAASAEKKLLAENLMGDSIYGSPVAVGDTLFIATRSNLFAIEEGAKAEAPPTE